MARKKELPIPPNAEKNDDSAELLRVWFSPDKGMEVTLVTAFKDPGAWGMVLANIAQHVARAYVNQGEGGETEARAIVHRISAGFQSSWNNPNPNANTEKFKK